MVRMGLQISANLENIENLRTNHPDYSFFVKMKCINCLDISNKWHDITESQRTEGDYNRRNSDTYNFYMKCRTCGRLNTINIVQNTNSPYTHEDSGKFKTIVIFECRGAELTHFSPRKGWIVRSAENGQTFEDVDLSEDDWVEYDQKNKKSVGIYKFTSQFVKVT